MSMRVFTVLPFLHMNDMNLPLYKTRKFWLVLISIQTVFSFLFLLPSALSENSGWTVLASLKTVTGFMAYYLIIFTVGNFSQVLLNLAYLLYFLLTPFLLFKIVFAKPFRLIYAAFYLVMLVLSTITAYFHIGVFG